MNELIEEIIAAAFELADSIESLLLSFSQRLSELDKRVRALEEKNVAESSNADRGEKRE